MDTRRRRWASLAAALTAGLLLAPVAQGAPGPKGPDKSSTKMTEQAPLLSTSSSDHYIVVLDKGMSTASAKNVRSMAASNGAKVYQNYSSAINGFAAKLPQRALTALRNNPNVAFIEADREFSISDTQSPATWGLDRIDQRSLPLNNAYTYQQTGAGVTAYIIDTGIRTSHSEFGGRAQAGYTAIQDGRGSNDCNGHGTHVAGTVGGKTYGVAKNVRLVAVRVLGCNGSGSTSGIIAGIDWVNQHHTSGPAVANMSLGGGASPALDQAVNNSIADGITYAVAAGNENQNACNVSPARTPNALTVASSTRTDARSSFSNWGSCVDLFAPGSDITAAGHSSDTATATLSGTSMASPHVAGVAALVLQASPNASPASVANTINNGATPNKISNPNGSPNRLLYNALAGGGTDPTPDPDPTPGGCDGMAQREQGSLSGSGSYRDHPGSTGYYYSSGSGTHRGCLSGPSGTDFDLVLAKWNGWNWVQVAISQSSTSSESITYTGTSGYYKWRVRSYSGSGSYTFGLTRP